MPDSFADRIAGVDAPVRELLALAPTLAKAFAVRCRRKTS